MASPDGIAFRKNASAVGLPSSITASRNMLPISPDNARFPKGRFGPVLRLASSPSFGGFVGFNGFVGDCYLDRKRVPRMQSGVIWSANQFPDIPNQPPRLAPHRHNLATVKPVLRVRLSDSLPALRRPRPGAVATVQPAAPLAAQGWRRAGLAMTVVGSAPHGREKISTAALPVWPCWWLHIVSPNGGISHSASWPRDICGDNRLCVNADLDVLHHHHYRRPRPPSRWRLEYPAGSRWPAHQ